MNFSGHRTHSLAKIFQKLLLKIKITVLLIIFVKILRFVYSTMVQLVTNGLLCINSETFYMVADKSCSNRVKQTFDACLRKRTSKFQNNPGVEEEKCRFRCNPRNSRRVIFSFIKAYYSRTFNLLKAIFSQLFHSSCDLDLKSLSRLQA